MCHYGVVLMKIIKVGMIHTGKGSRYNALLCCLVRCQHTRIRTNYTESVMRMKYINYSISNPGYVVSVMLELCTMYADITVSVTSCHTEVHIIVHMYIHNSKPIL